MATCDYQQLLDESKCFGCLSSPQLLRIIAALLCDIKVDSGGGGPGTGLISAFDVYKVLNGVANTPVIISPFGLTFPVVKAIILADETNTEDMLIGGSLVATSGVPIKPGTSYNLDAEGKVFDLQDVWVTSTADFKFNVMYFAQPA